MTKVISAFCGLALLVLATGSAATAGGTKSPVVVELFTSQGCSSCPPAEAFLGELAKRKDVIALEFHVDYWDYIGWKDHFAKPEFTARQKRYVRSLKSRYSYTPQMVIDGRTHVVGSHRGEVEDLIRKYRADERGGPAINVSRKGDMLKIQVESARADAKYDVVLVTFDRPHVTQVRRGENRGKRLKNYNVVREVVPLGTWDGKPATYEVSLDGKEGDGGCAILVQKDGQGPVLAAVKMPFEL
jgi:hypothetical protein